MEHTYITSEEKTFSLIKDLFEMYGGLLIKKNNEILFDDEGELEFRMDEVTGDYMEVLVYDSTEVGGYKFLFNIDIANLLNDITLKIMGSDCELTIQDNNIRYLICSNPYHCGGSSAGVL